MNHLGPTPPSLDDVLHKGLVHIPCISTYGFNHLNKSVRYGQLQGFFMINNIKLVTQWCHVGL